MQQTRAAEGKQGTLGVYGVAARRGIKKRHGQSKSKEVLDHAKTRYFGENQAGEGEDYQSRAAELARKASRGTGSREDEATGRTVAQDLAEDLVTSEANKMRDLHLKEVEAAVAHFRHTGQPQNELSDMAKSGLNSKGERLSAVEREAAIQMATRAASVADAHELIAHSGTMDTGQRQALVQALRESGFSKKATHFGGGAMNAVAEGQVTTHEQINQLVTGAANSGKFSQATLAVQDSHTLKLLAGVLDGGNVSDGNAARIRSDAENALRSASNRGIMNDRTREQLERIRR